LRRQFRSVCDSKTIVWHWRRTKERLVISLLKKVENFLGWIARVFCYFSGAFMLFLMLIIIGDICCRTFLEFSIIGTPAFARNSLIAITFLALPQVTWFKKHVRCELFANKAKGLMKKILEVVTYGGGVLAFFLLTRALYYPTLQAIRIHETDKEGMTFIPLSPFYIICLISVFFCLLGSIRIFIRVMSDKKEEGDSESDFSVIDV
jgi:TRAP-type C4-dicarboxylate transport system permease small subunit